jgi:glutamine amidotransferase
MITIINYGSGNIQAICNIYGRLRIPYLVTDKPEDVRASRKIILPGVGAFDQAMGELDRSGLRSALDAAVLGEKKPILGICVGMQLLAKSSEEGVCAGLGWIDGVVKRFSHPVGTQRLQLPHMGWNHAQVLRPDPLFDGLDLSSGFYFLHSYYFSCADASEELTRTEYGAGYASAVRKGNIYGVQFHPEKSHQAGIGVLRNFALAVT